MRTKEVLLLLLPLPGFLAAYQILAPAGALRLALLPFAVFAALSALLHLARSRTSEFLLPLAAFLTQLGLLNLYQIKPEYYERQLLNLVIAGAVFAAIFIVARFFDLFAYRYLAASLALALLLLPVFFGVEKGGARLWVSFGSFSFQPAEIAKVLLMLFFAAYFAEHRIFLKGKREFSLSTELAYLAPALLMTALSLLLLVFVKDLGFSFFILTIFLLSLYLASGRLSYVLGSVFVFLIGAAGAYRLFAHVRARVNIWLNPWRDVTGTAYQIVQSFFAYAEGGVTGTGFGQGFPRLLPAAHTDMVLPVLGEAAGFTAVLFVFTAYLLFVLAATAAAVRTRRPAHSLYLLIFGFALFLQAFLVAAGTAGLLPLTGITTPFLSYGGSSLVSQFAALAIALHAAEGREHWIVR